MGTNITRVWYALIKSQLKSQLNIHVPNNKYLGSVYIFSIKLSTCIVDSARHLWWVSVSISDFMEKCENYRKTEQTYI